MICSIILGMILLTKAAEGKDNVDKRRIFAGLVLLLAHPLHFLVEGWSKSYQLSPQVKLANVEALSSAAAAESFELDIDELDLKILRVKLIFG